jgi:hypothetical protein
VRFQFVEILVRIAIEKYIRTGQCKTVTGAFRRLLDEGLQKILDNAEDTRLWREERYWL